MTNTYTTSRGIKIEFLSIPRAIQKFYAAHPAPEPPTYEVKTALGVPEKYPHNETTLETDADKAAWAAYQQAVRDHNEKFLRVCFVKGMLIHASMEEWLAEQAALEIPVAEDPLERKVEWILDAIILTEEDFKAAMLGVMQASGANEELLTQIESLFRDSVGRRERETAESTSIPADESSLVLQPVLRGEFDGVRVENPEVPVRQVEEAGSVKRHRRTARAKSNGNLGTNHGDAGSGETEPTA